MKINAESKLPLLVLLASCRSKSCLKARKGNEKKVAKKQGTKQFSRTFWYLTLGDCIAGKQVIHHL